MRAIRRISMLRMGNRLPHRLLAVNKMGPPSWNKQPWANSSNVEDVLHFFLENVLLVKYHSSPLAALTW